MNTRLLIVLLNIFCTFYTVYSKTPSQQEINEGKLRASLQDACLKNVASFKTKAESDDYKAACLYCSDYCAKHNTTNCMQDCFKSYVYSVDGNVSNAVGIEALTINLPDINVPGVAPSIQGYVFENASSSIIPINQSYTLVNNIFKPTINSIVPNNSPFLVDLDRDPAKIVNPVFGTSLSNKNQTILVPVCAAGMTWNNTISIWTAPDNASAPGENYPLVIANQAPNLTQWLVFNKALFFQNIEKFITLKRAKVYFIPFVWLNLTFDGIDGTINLNSLKLVVYTFPKYDLTPDLSTMLGNFIVGYFEPGGSIEKFGTQATAQIITITGDQIKNILPAALTTSNPGGYKLPENTGCITQ